MYRNRRKAKFCCQNIKCVLWHRTDFLTEEENSHEAGAYMAIVVRLLFRLNASLTSRSLQGCGRLEAMSEICVCTYVEMFLVKLHKLVVYLITVANK